MPRFAYTARDSKGKVYRGTVDAASPTAVASRLRSDGYFVTSVQPVSQRLTVKRELISKKLSKQDLAIFCRQLATLLKAGVPITDALSVVRNQTSQPALAEALKQLVVAVQTGDSISAAMGKQPKIFPQLLVRMVEAGEASGTIDATFDNLSKHYQRDYELQQKIVSALTYPAVVLVVAVIVVILLFGVVLPNFVDMFSDLGAELPGSTKLLIATGNWWGRYWLVILLAIIAAAIALTAYVKTDKGRRWKDQWLLRLPVIGSLLTSLEITRFSRNLSVMLAAGIPIVQGVELITKLAENTLIQEAFATAVEAIKRGGSLSAALAKTKLFPEMVPQMLEIGETTGALDLLLLNIAEFYDGEVDNQIKALTMLIEPVVVIFLGGVVALIIASVLLPMFDMMGQIGG